MGSLIERAVMLWEPPPSMYTRQAVLVYDVADPYAVAVCFASPSGRTPGIEWRFARELLVDAVELGREVGEGDVRVRIDQEGWITLVIYPEADCGLPLLVQREVVAEFLAASYAAVPVGTESARIDWDAELAQVFGGAA
ncbi:SsgA family sporulation/cell division regulator [Sphaerisporangium sp. NPDC005288]|uniref:SsgA family sporulation/cell division regulator n=1 Tax=Sphaerisporangium sp. NPDC005288 TaxID=3155114 RepID=UPI0033A2CC40